MLAIVQKLFKIIKPSLIFPYPDPAIKTSAIP